MMRWHTLVKINFPAPYRAIDTLTDLLWEQMLLDAHLIEARTLGAVPIPRSTPMPAHHEDEMREKYYARRDSGERYRKTFRGDGLKKKTIKLGNTGADPGYTVHLWVRKSRVPDGASIEAASV